MFAAVPTALKQILGDDFDDIRPLGEDGGLSRLFRARKKSLNVDVVIKRMRVDPNRPADVQREARVMTGLRHQYLPRIFDLKMDGQGYCYTIMELIHGSTLRQYVRQHGALSQKQMLRWMKQLCQVVEYMHAQRPAIIHSDIKPENIMITTQGDICLIDFNTSLELRDTGVDAVGATVGYAAPEQYNVPLQRFGDPATLSPERRTIYNIATAAQGYGKVTVRSDLYAIGAVAYFMITGYDPAGWSGNLIPLERYDIQLNDPLRQVIVRCMEKRQSDRFSSASEVLRALDNLTKMDGRYRAWRHSCQVATLVIGIGIILSCFSIFWGWLTLRQEKGTEYNALIQQAQMYAEQNNYANQEELLLQAISLDRERPEAYANLGALLYRQGDYPQAIELLSRVETDESGVLNQVENAVAYGQIQYILASCYYQTKDYMNALTAYQIAALFCPEDTAYQRDLAVCYAKCGYIEEAQQTATQLSVATLRPGDQELVFGEIAFAGGQYEQAVEQLARAAQLSEDHSVISRATLQAALCCRYLGDDQLSREIELLQSAVRRLDASENGIHLEELAEALIRRASIQPLLRQESYEQALTCLQELTARGQATFAVRQNAALVLQYLDRFEEAEQALLDLQTDYANDYRPAMRLSLLYIDWENAKAPQERDYWQAVQHYEQALALYPSSQVDNEMVRLHELIGQLN